MSPRADKPAESSNRLLSAKNTCNRARRGGSSTCASGSIPPPDTCAFQILARQGARVVAAARGDHAASTAAAIVEAGGIAESASVDVTDRDALAALPGAIVERHGRIDILVSNAGIARDQLLMRMKREEWDDVIATNLTAAFTLAQAAMRPMLKQRGGRIIAVSSVVGQMGNIGQVNYAASKSGLFGFTQSLARETANKGITVNCVAPGYIETEMVAAVPEAAMEKILAKIPVGRLGQAHEIARAVQFLVDDDAGFITGSVISVNGGMDM